MHARYYNNSLGRFLSVDPKWESSDPRKPQTLNRYSYAQNNPLTRIDPDGRRDVYVAVWNAKYPYVAGRGSVGHAAMFEMSGKTIVSQFPEPHGTHGKNETLTYGQTVIKENGRLPDKVFRVTLPNDAELDAARNAQRATKWWDADPDPDDNETHCSAAVYSLLKAGGANILLIGFGAPLPSDVQDILAQVARKQKGSPYPTVREVPRDTIQSTPDRFKK
jgi:hypothetical protein